MGKRGGSTRRKDALKLNFTKAALLALACPKGKDRIYWHDQKTLGLCVSVTAGGRLTLYCYRKVNGRPERIKLGRYPDDLTIEQARQRVHLIAGKVTEGANPQDARRDARQELTLGQLFADWLDRHAKGRKKTWRADQWQFDKYLCSWRTRRISTISTADAAQHHSRLGQTSGIYTANRVRALLSTLYGHAQRVLQWQGVNPTDGVERFKEESRERFLERSEVRQFFEALKREPSELIRDYITISLFTGQRRRNILRMRWDQIDLAGAKWTISAAQAKAGKVIAVPLSPPAVDILCRRKEVAQGDWVFPAGRQGTKYPHMTEPIGGWHRVLKRAGISGLRLHDLRRSLGSWMAAGGTSLHTIGRTLGHTDQRSTAVYARLQLGTLRQGVDGAVTALLEAANGD